MANSTLGSFEKGVFIYENTSGLVAEKKYIRYEKEDLSIYKDKFIDLIGDGVFKEECLFEDHKWIAYGTKHYETFDFRKIEYNQHFYLPLKCFVIVQLFDKNLVVDMVHEKFTYILKMISMTGGYDIRLLKDFVEFVEINGLEKKTTLSKYKKPNLDFIYFNPINDSKDYIEILLNIKEISRYENVREIPTYSNFILFDEIIHDFMLNTTPYLREKYYPIFIWWRLTSVIPIRPIEFIEILNEGIRYETKEEAFYVLIPRRKQQPDPINNSKQIAIQHELKLNKEVYYIISDFRELANIGNSKYLFPLSAYTKFLKREDLSLKRIHYKEHMNWQQMTTLLDEFFDKIVNSQFNIEVVQTREELDRENEHKTIKRFNLGDTRHMSICMMMMQGFSELTIAQMAGHKDIRTQSHYSSHIDDFQRSYSGILEKSIIQKMNVGDKSGFDSFTFRQKQLLSYSNRDNSNARKKDFGYCHSENFPYDCFSKDCIFCNKFQLDLSKLSEEEIRELKNKVTKVQDEIQVKLNFIKKYYGTAFKKKDSSINSNESEIKELERNAINLNTLINQEAMIKVHLKNYKEV
ncbi:hypothetical protein G6549_26700 [Bacillus sp. MM2020_1]|nr:hypothetical protein [Bacillus sp. MM2020_1]